MPRSLLASQLNHLFLCRRDTLFMPRRHRTFLCLLLWFLTGASGASAQTNRSVSTLGDAKAARLQARRFLAGRTIAGSAGAGSAVAGGVPAQANFVDRAKIVPRPAALSNLASAWTPLGPVTVASSQYGAISGRITSVAVDPNDTTGNAVWVGTTGGGVWKSTNAAAPMASVTFSPLTDTLPVFSPNAGSTYPASLSIGAVALQPSPNPVVLAGTGDPNDASDSYYGVGILRSADGGQTWTLATESKDGVNGTHSFLGLATSGVAWSTATPTLAVAAMSSSAEGGTVGAAALGAIPGLYYSTDAGVTWQSATVMDGSQIIQAPSGSGTAGVGAPATSVVWDAQRGLFFAALQFHGYYSSSDGESWTRLTHQPGTGLTTANCPTEAGGQGSVSCPIFRGTLAVQPATGDLYALTVDANEQDQGLWQDLCNQGSNGQCASASPSFASRLDGGALEVGQGAPGGSAQIIQGSYNLALLATPSAGGGTLLFAGTLDLYRCALSAGSSACSFRNTTNAANGCNAPSAVAPAQHALAASAQTSASPILFIGNDGGLWRSADGVAETGPPCSSTDAAHFQNLNTAIGTGGSLAEVIGFAQDPSQTGTLIVGLGASGSAATMTAGPSASWSQLSAGEGGLPSIDQSAPGNWYVAIGAGVNVKACGSGGGCTAADFSGSADVGAIQTMYDAALLDAPTLLDPQAPSQLLTGTCRVWRGPASGGSSWNAGNGLSPAMDGGTTPCTVNSALIRSLAAGGPVNASGASANRGSEVLYAGMAGVGDGGGSLPGHLFVTKGGDAANASTSWTDITGSPVQNSYSGFNSYGFDLSSVVADPHDATGATVFATVMGFGSGAHVYRSTDFGAHWSNVSANLPDAPANSLVVDPNDANTVYVAMDTGVYATQAIATCATQNCWSVLGSALPNAPVTQLQAGAGLATGDGRVGLLRAGTYGRGLWQTPLLTAHTLLQPQLSASPASLTFLPEQVGTRSDPVAVTLLSFGNAPVTVSSIVVAGDFTETDTCTGQNVAVNANCTVSVRFSPTATGGRTGLLTIYANVPSGQITVALSGTGLTAAAIVLTPLQLSFPAMLVNQTSAAQIITVSNTGQTTATLQSPGISGDFVLGANTCGSSLPPQTGCSLAVIFKPTASGTRSGVLTLSDSAGTQTAQLTGVGQSPATDTLSPLSLSFPPQQLGTSSAPQQVLLANAGDVPLTLITAVIVAGDFTAINGCGPSLAPHSSCAINVGFAPTVTGSRTGTLQITDQFRTQTVSLSGAGLAPPGVSLSPSALDFGSVGVSHSASGSSVLLTNNGGMPLTLTSTAITGDFSIASTSCAASVAPAGTCSLVVVFSPTAPGVRSGTLTIKDNAGSGSQSVTLSGIGIDFGLAADGPTSVTVTSGTVATFPLRLTSVAGLSGAVVLGCTGAPANAVCTLTPSTAQLGGDVLVSVTVQTGLSTTGRVQPNRKLGREALFCFLGLFLPISAVRRKRLNRALAPELSRVVGLLAIFWSLIGCGSTRLIPLSGTGGTGGGGGGTGTLSQPTTPGTYPLVVSGAADGVTHSVNLSLVVN